MAVPAIRTSRLTKDYGFDRGLFDLDLEVAAQQVFGFLGPNGAGKTTTIRCVMGMIRPTSGSAHVFGIDCMRDSVEVKRKVGYLPGDMPQFGGMRGREVVAYLGGMRGGFDRRRVRDLAARLDLDLGRRYREYSSGNRRKLGLVLAFMHSPELLILDEPTSGLDPIARHDLLNQLVGEVAASGTTVFFSSHILSEVEAVADWVGIINAGKLVVSGELDQLKSSQKILKLIYAEVPPASEVDVLRALRGVVRVDQEGRSVRITARGDIDAIAKMVQTRPYALRDVEIVNLNLEDIFLEYMREDSNGNQGAN